MARFSLYEMFFRAEGFALHGGNTDTKGQWIPELAYTYAQGAMRCNLLAGSLPE
eukprot:m.88483 g.88483  ORF g.88483 m.88483 type:complete len:54 (+) comp14942_c0_seq4:134-295(+)